MDDRRRVLLCQGLYYAVTGVAPFISRRAFATVTGPKLEWWLVETVGALVTAVGAGVTAAALRDRVTPEILTIAVGSAAGLGAIDIVYAARGRIAPAYLIDAGVQAGLIAALARAQATSPSGEGRLRPGPTRG
jgi:hypothetical protein